MDELLEDLLGTEELRQRVHREFAAHRCRWEIAAAAIGLGPVEGRVNLAWDRWEALTETVWQAPVGSFAGVAAKLAMVLSMGQSRSDDDEFPWPPLRSVLVDLQRLAPAGAGIASFFALLTLLWAHWVHASPAWAAVGIGCAIAAGASDYVENILLMRVLGALPRRADAAVRAATAFTRAKFIVSYLTLAIPVAQWLVTR